MNTYYLHRLPRYMFLLLICTTSCNGQGETADKLLSGKQTKIIIPPGSDVHGMFRCSMKDRAGNLWFGTTSAGLYRYDGTSFTHFSEKEGLPVTAVYSVIEDRAGYIWVGTDSGLFRSEGSIFKSVDIPGAKYWNTTVEGGMAGLGNDHDCVAGVLPVYCMAVDKKGNVWFGTEACGLWRYDGAAFTNFRYVDNAWKIVSNDSLQYNAAAHSGLIQYIMEDKDGRIWFTTAGSKIAGLKCYDGKSISK